MPKFKMMIIFSMDTKEVKKEVKKTGAQVKEEAEELLRQTNELAPFESAGTQERVKWLKIALNLAINSRNEAALNKSKKELEALQALQRED